MATMNVHFEQLIKPLSHSGRDTDLILILSAVRVELHSPCSNVGVLQVLTSSTAVQRHRPVGSLLRNCPLYADNWWNLGGGVRCCWDGGSTKHDINVWNKCIGWCSAQIWWAESPFQCCISIWLQWHTVHIHCFSLACYSASPTLISALLHPFVQQQCSRVPAWVLHVLWRVPFPNGLQRSHLLG